MSRRRAGRAWVGASIVLAAAAAICPRLRFDEPPRFDGAGYATLARSLARGTSYREITHPDAPVHVHFPPGYPLALAAVFRLPGDPVRLAHGFSVACTLVAVWMSWRRWVAVKTRRVATLLGLALAWNWTWVRAGGAIQSEPLFVALMASTLLLAAWAARRGGLGRASVVGLAVGLCILTRHVGACLAVAIAIDWWHAGKRRAILAMAGAAAAVVAPWIAWQLRAGGGTQAGLFRSGSLLDLIVDQVVFYARRMPDQVVGPFVEVATVFGRSPAVAALATIGAFGFSSIVVLGWVRLARNPRRRLGGLVPLATMPLLLVWPFTEAGRFLVPLVPFLLEGAVEGMATLARRIRPHRRSRLVASVLILGATLPYSAYSLISDREGARIATHADFDAACRWIATRYDHPGPVLARHPADAAWLTGRFALEGGDGEIDRQIRRRGVAFLVVDDARYARVPSTSLGAFAARSPDRVRLAWGADRSVQVYEVRREEGQGGSALPAFPGESR